ncbi:MAG: EpsG family protein [Bacteroidaceae bacterium]|nr:EpsG family protein [Bacteroidaceae bacterium]
MIGDLLVYNVLRTLLFATLLLCGKTISISKKKGMITVCSVCIIVTFSLIEGLRWDRGPDYYNNYLLLTTNDLSIVKSEPLFNTIIGIFKKSLLPYWCAFIFFSFLYIYSFSKVVKEFPKAAVWALPIMFLVTVDAHENLIRQFIAISFFLFAYYFYIKQKKTPMLLCLICIFNIHLSGLFVIAIFLFLISFKIERYIRKPSLLVGIYLILHFFWDTSYLNPITNYLNTIDLGDVTMQGYIDNTDRWFTNEGSISALQGKSGAASFMTIFFRLVTNCTIIYWGFKAIKIDERLRIPYWFTFFAFIIHIIGGDIEIYRRFAWWLYYFMPLVLGAIWYLVPMNNKIRMTLMLIIAFSYTYSFIMRYTTIPYSGFAFVWDR